MVKRITSLQHPLIKKLVKLRKDAAFRKESQSIVIVGKHQTKEVCARTKANIILSTDESLIPKGIKFVEAILVTEEIVKKITGVTAPEGILAEVPMPQESSLAHCRYVVALDGISDPGNLGTIMRTALALGWEGAFILDQSADPYNDKALRAAKGAAFRLPLRMGNWNDLEKFIKNNRFTAFAADLEGEHLKNFSPPDKIMLVLGSESQGISERALSICRKITIPMPGAMESLNVAVAGGILMYQLRNSHAR